MSILVTGGAGYIGSHTCVELINSGYSVIIVDNLINSKVEFLNSIRELTDSDLMFYNVDVKDKNGLEKVFQKHKIEGVIHFAGLKSVSESFENPLDYYENNVYGTINVTQLCNKYEVNNFVFSSSATVYGNNSSPLNETMERHPSTNPYGNTKKVCEDILIDSSHANKSFSVSLLRYFNPVGAHDSALIGESPNNIPNNIMPFITKVAKGEVEKLKIFGDDYPTRDGTGVRDYIHVVDLAKGHVAALKNIQLGVNIYNLGTGTGTSVLELVNTFQAVNNVEVPYEIVDRRPGDIAICYADVKKAQIELGWLPKMNLSDMCSDAWRFEVRNSSIF